MPAIEPGPDGLRASDLIGQDAYNTDGQILGRIADLVVEGSAVVGVVVTKGIWGRLLGYERDGAHGPWLIEAVAHRIMRHDSQHIAWDQLRLVNPSPPITGSDGSVATTG